METLRKLLDAECDHRMSKETMDALFDFKTWFLKVSLFQLYS
jgi:hypothetical protein